MEQEFNKIYVIESLPDSETKTGTNLYNDIIRRKLWNLQPYQSELVIINSKLEFLNLFEKVKSEIIDNKIIPFFHFEIHGSPNGFLLRSNERVSWLELHHRFIELNILVNNKIWISLATCYGAYIHSIIQPTDRSPFYGYIGSWEELNIEDLQASFERFFDILLDEFDFLKALNGLNLENPNLPTEYKIGTSKEVFKRVYDNYEKKFFEPARFQERLDNLVKEALTDPQNKILNLSENFYRQNAERMLIKDKVFYRRKFEHNFFLIDLYPANLNRFDLQ